MLHKFGPIIRQYAVVIAVNLSLLGTGVGLTWPSPVLVKLRNETETVLSEPITSEQGSWVVSIGFLTGMLANLITVLLVDRIGRKYTLIVACVPKVASGILYLCATEVWMLLLGRAVAGASDALIFTVTPMYASEVASKEIRGSLGTILQIVCSIGVVLMLCIGPFLPYLLLNGIYTAIIVATTVPLFFLPHSPYFLYSKGRNTEAHKVLTFLRGSELLASEELKEYSLQSTSPKTSSREIIRNRIFIKTFVLVLIITAGAQLSGFNSISFYLQTILESTQTSMSPEVCSVIIGLIQLLASFCTTMVTDRFGRKTILTSTLVGLAVGMVCSVIIGLIQLLASFCTTMVTDRFGRKTILTSTLVGLAVGMVGLGAFFFIKGDKEVVQGFMNFLPLMSLVLVVYSYSAGVGSINWVLQAELFDDRSRGIGLSLTSLLSYVVLFLCTKYFPFLITALGPAVTFWWFGLNCVLFTFFIVFFVPETKGKTFAEIQVALGARLDHQKDNEKA